MSEEDIIVPYIPDTIMTIFKGEYPQIQELLEYKRDGTLMFLKSQGAIAFYNGSFGLNVKKDVKDWEEFREFARNYTKTFIQEGLEYYQNKEKDVEEGKKKFKILDQGNLVPIIQLIANGINDEYLKRFPSWPKTCGSQEDFINISMKGNFETNNLKFYWLCRGIIKVKDTKYSSPINGCIYRAEFSGKPEFQLAYFDLDKIRQCNEMAKNKMSVIKKLIDGLEEKYLEQKLTKLLISIDL